MSKPVTLDVQNHLDAMLRYARTLSRGNAADADDLVHEALVKALEAKDNFRLGGNLRGWLMSIVHNTFVSGHRRRRAEERRTAAASLVADPVALPEQEGRARLAAVVAAFDRLPEDQRTVLHLVAVEGLSYQEAADVLGVPVGTVMSRLSRAREALRRWEAGNEAKRPGLTIVGGTDAP